MSRAWRIDLNFCERAVFAEDGERFKENFIIRPRGPIGQVMHHEVRSEKIGPVAARTVTLPAAGKVQLRGLQEFLFDMKSGVERILDILCHQSAEKIRSHACVQILADLQSDFDFFGERRRNVLRDLVFGGIETRKRGKVSRRWTGWRLDFNTRGYERFTKD